MMWELIWVVILEKNSLGEDNLGNSRGKMMNLVTHDVGDDKVHIQVY
jgi:hypothetical protein